ncbi:MAG: hypothetical protein A2W22_01930 [Candidatus Levybacteria bacterium RBG_16_35_11]|nr:MAG: hypothetical protein A2W22_01930 [Candidatus Levybacteria bacterium RBG_16_35_11]
MTKKCSLKEAFIEKKLDEYQLGWRQGEDITSETKKKIQDYVASILPEELEEDATCISDYSIQHMARKIRKRENLPEPKTGNKGNSRGNDKVSETTQETPKTRTADNFKELLKELKSLLGKFPLSDIRKAIDMLEKSQDSRA